MAKKTTTRKAPKSSSFKLSRITKSGKIVEVYSGSTKSAKKVSGVLYGKMLRQESDDMRRLSKWHSRAKPQKATVTKQGKQVRKISGFKKGKDGQIIGVEK